MKFAADINLPVINLAAWLESRDGADRNCALAAECMREYGIAIIHDPRLDPGMNGRYIDMLERYFARPPAELATDARPNLHYQVGLTPAHVEHARIQPEWIDELPAGCAPYPHDGPDEKMRFFWPIGGRPSALETAFPQFNLPPAHVIPAGIPEWENGMTRWGEAMLGSVGSFAEMLGAGLGLGSDKLVGRMHHGPHLLAPTAVDLSRFPKVETVLTDWHYDFNLLTIHGQSRFPGLIVWLRDGRPMVVRVPDGCLLVQAGMQLEFLTGGTVKAGFHQVAVLPETLAAVARAIAEGRSVWRISSTLFAHVNSMKMLQPLRPFRNAETEARYRQILAGDHMAAELEAIKLARPATSSDAT